MGGLRKKWNLSRQNELAGKVLHILAVWIKRHPYIRKGTKYEFYCRKICGSVIREAPQQKIPAQCGVFL
jgi:hypothetical protein